MKKFLSFVAALLVAVTSFTSCNNSPAAQLQNAVEAKDMVKTKQITDQIYNDKANADTETLMVELIGLFTVCGDMYGNNKPEEGAVYKDKFNEIYDLVQNRPDYEKVIGGDKEAKAALEMLKDLLGMFDLMDSTDLGTDSTDAAMDLEAKEAM